MLASPASEFSLDPEKLDETNAKFVKSTAAAVGKSAPVQYSWTKTNVQSTDVWYVRAYLVYTYQGKTITIYGDLVEFTAL